CMLLKMIIQLRKRNKKVTFRGLDASILEIFKLTQLNRFVQTPNNDSASSISGSQHAQESALINNSSVKHSSGGDIENSSSWAKPVPALYINWIVPGEARNLNVVGRKAVGPVNGFGALWQKTYRLYIRDSDINPELVARVMKENFPSFQPSYNRFYPSPSGIAPGEIVLIDSMTPGGPVSTGVMVMYSDDLSFTFVTPQGHPESGWVSFSAYTEGDRTVAQICGLARAGDPLFEAAFRLVGSKMQVRIWTHVLASLAAYLGVPANISCDACCADPELQWNQASNITYNAQIITLLREPSRWFS
ncbi:MAG: hypothetical protein AB7V04_04865, partial [Desulfomonilaceae bacterium]